jgi:outer membrane biosynthesis protein TonB
MAPLPAPASEKPLTRLRMRPTNEANNKKKNQAKVQSKKARRSKPTKNEAKTESQEKQEEGPKKAAKGRTQTATTQPPTHYESRDSCLGRSLVIPNVRKALA